MRVEQRLSYRQPLTIMEQIFESLVTLAPVGIFASDANGQCWFVNQRWQEIAELPLEAALGDGWAKRLHPDDRARVFEAWQMSVERGQEFSLEYRFAHSDGGIVWVAGTAVATRDAQGAIDGYIGTIVDITARKQAEADDGPEYVIERLGCYQRLFRETETVAPVNPPERAMLDVCIATFTELAARCARLVLEPPPPRYRPGAKKLLN